MSQLVEAPIGAVDANPFRRLGDYPYVERKLAALKRSIAEVGLWEGVIARHTGNRYEIAFGHHRVEAARQSELTMLSLVVRDLTDKQMLQFMGRENLEDYNADFLTMLETWEAGTSWTAGALRQKSQPIDTARLLGWTELSDSGGTQMNATARACFAASALERGKYITRADLRSLTVNEANLICGRAQATMERLETMARTTKRPAEEIKVAKAHVGKAVKETARQSRSGHVAQKDLRGQVDLNTYRFSREAPRPSPLFEVFGKQLADNIEKMLDTDTAAKKLAEIQKAIPQVTFDDDKRILKRIDYELGELGERAETWRKRITTTGKKVSHLQIGE